MQRIVRTVLVTIALFALTSGTFGFAVAASSNDAPGGIDAPRPGDRAVYTANQFIIGENAGGDLGTIRVVYEWMPEEWRMDDEFQLRLVHPIKMTGYFQGGSEYTRWGYVDAATGEGIATAGHGATYVQQPDQGLVGNVVASYMGTDAAEAEYHSVWYTGHKGACAMSTALHGAASIPERLRVEGHCDYLDGDKQLVYAYQGTVDRRGEEVLHYQHPTRSHFEAYYTRDNPFPAEFTTSLSNMIYGPWLEGRMYRLHLQSFERGSDAYTPAEEPVIEPSPGPATPIERPDFDLDSASMDALFSFNDAWDAILADTAEPRMEDYLRDHPDAYMALASYTESQDDDGARRGHWAIGAADGSSYLYKVATHEPALRTAGIDIVGYQTTVATREQAYYQHPPKALADSKMISIEDQVERFRFFFGNEQLVNSVSYWVACDDPCSTASTTMWLGHVERSTENEVGFLDGSRYGFQLIRTSLKGTPNMVYAYEQVTHPQVPLAADGDGSAVAPNQGTNGGAVWQPPSAAVAGGFGALALVGGALYHFWPVLKGLPFLGGFSRISSSSLLQHKTRSALMDLVQDNPGIHFQEVMRRLNLARGTTSHHLLKMEQGGLIRSRSESGRTCYFAPHVGREEAAVASVLQAPGTRRIYDVVRANPAMPSSEVAAQVGMAPSTVSYHLKKLRKAGLAA